LGRPGGGVDPLTSLLPVGVGGVESNPGGARLDLTRAVPLLLGGEVKSTALVDLVSNPLPLAIPLAPTPRAFGPDIAGDAVCARGGGAGGAGLATSSPACGELLQSKHSTFSQGPPSY